MTALSEFETDLRKAAIESAEFLRQKSAKLNKDDDYAEYYSGEREFVAECYRRLISINDRYLSNILIEYYKPKRNERNPMPVYPDIVFHDSKNGRAAVEVKSVWFMPGRKEGLYKRDEDRICGDYEKLRDYYTKFDSKIMLVAFLGVPDKYRGDPFKQYVESLVHGNSLITVITC